MWEKSNCHSLLEGMKIDPALMQISLEASHSITNRTTIWHSYTIRRCIGKELHILLLRYLNIHVYCAYSWWQGNGTGLSISKWLDNEFVLLKHNMISFGFKENKIMKLTRILMDLERIVLSKAIQTQKEKLNVFSHTWTMAYNVLMHVNSSRCG